MEKRSIRPFSQGYVLRSVTRNMRKSIDYSIRKTAERIADFGDGYQSKEVLSTLSSLHLIRKMIGDFELQNNELFTGDLANAQTDNNSNTKEK